MRRKLPGEVARRVSASGQATEVGHDRRAGVGEPGVGAPGMEGAAGRDGGERRWVAGDAGEASPGLGPVDPGKRCEQPTRVGVRRRREHLADAGRLDQPARVHDRDPIGQAGHDAEVVGDEHDGRAGALLDAAQHLEHLGLHGDVERRGRLVGDEDVRVVGHGHGDDDPLLHPTRQLVRIAPGPGAGVGDADQVEQLRRPVPHPGAGQAGIVGGDRLGDLVAHPLDRVQGGQRLLEHDGQPPAAEPVEVALGQPEEVAPFEDDGTRHRGGRGQQAHGGQHGDGLARAGLADDGQHLVLVHLERHAVDSLQHTVVGREPDPQIPHREDGRAVGLGQQVPPRQNQSTVRSQGPFGPESLRTPAGSTRCGRARRGRVRWEGWEGGRW